MPFNFEKSQRRQWHDADVSLSRVRSDRRKAESIKQTDARKLVFSDVGPGQWNHQDGSRHRHFKEVRSAFLVRIALSVETMGTLFIFKSKECKLSLAQLSHLSRANWSFWVNLGNESQ